MARTAEAEAAARDVAAKIRATGRMDYDAAVADARFDAKYLETPEGGKMIGALVGACATTGERTTLKAFSGQLFGAWRVEGWAPPVGELTHDTEYYRREHAKIKALSERIAKATVEEKMTRAEVRAAAEAGDDETRALAAEAKRAKEARRRARARGASEAAMRALDDESRASKRAVSTLKKARDAAVAPKLEILARLRARIDDMKAERKALSRALQDKIWDSYKLPSIGGDVRPLRDVFYPPVDALPCGCADCAAPKLLAWAHARGITPISIAEIWIGASRPRDFRVHGVAYGACRDKCVPIMGHMLCPERFDAA
jgi:tRNA pseudouridine32 synthase/23S rRNA pseudouridine746 synthase